MHWEMGCESFAVFDMLALQAHRPAAKAFVLGADVGAAITKRCDGFLALIL